MLNALLGREDATKEVSQRTGKGKHTTTGSRLYTTADKTQWIDTPGIKEFRLAGVTLDQARECFPELQQACQADGCFHLPPPPLDDSEEVQVQGCLAMEMLRYKSYLHIVQSIAEEEEQGA